MKVSETISHHLPNHVIQLGTSTWTENEPTEKQTESIRRAVYHDGKFSPHGSGEIPIEDMGLLMKVCIEHNKISNKELNEITKLILNKGGDKKLIIDGGAVFFGLVLGWLTFSAFYSNNGGSVKELAALFGIIGGAAVTKLFSKTETQFAMYCVGLAAGFFLHVIINE